MWSLILCHLWKDLLSYLYLLFWLLWAYWLVLKNFQCWFLKFVMLYKFVVLIKVIKFQAVMKSTEVGWGLRPEWYSNIHWVPLKTQHKILCNLRRFLYLDFPEIWRTIGKNCYLKVSKISGKNIQQGKNDIIFSEVTPKRNFTSSYRCVACHYHDMFNIAPSFCVHWLFCGIFLKIFFFVAFLSIFKH